MKAGGASDPNRRHPIWTACSALIALLALSDVARAACDLELQGEGRVGAVIDGRTLRLIDGREIRLIGIEPAPASYQDFGASLLRTRLGGAEVTLHGASDAPDRYGRQHAFVFAYGEDTPVQRLLLAQGLALAAGDVAEVDCAAELKSAEAMARAAKLGLWSEPAAIKKAENPAAILAQMGRFIIVEGKVVSARRAGATFYINFSRNWVAGFAVTISRRMMPSFEAAGLKLAELSHKTIRVRGFVSQHGGPRIEAFGPGQIELIDDRGAAAAIKGN